MKATILGAAILIAASAAATLAAEPVSFHSPGLPPSRMDAEGRLCEDWGSVGVRLSGPAVADGATTVEAVKLEGVVPAARAVSARGAVRLVCTAYRSPAYPQGIDVLAVRVEEVKGQAAQVNVTLDLPPKARIGLRTVKVGSRTVVTLPAEAIQDQQPRDWGYCDEASSLPGWAKPLGKCDPAFRNIRAGMGGVPILYRFAVKPKSEAHVVLGLCESHWKEARQRPLLCRVEGADPQQVDPVGQWGQHKPGVLLFHARDENGDGQIEVNVRSATGANDRNPILNAIWIFPPGKAPDLVKLLSGALSKAAIRYVDVGGETDQSLYPPGKLDYRLSLSARGAKELVFWVASQGGSAPIPETTAWTTDLLRRAAHDVWRDWSER